MRVVARLITVTSTKRPCSRHQRHARLDAAGARRRRHGLSLGRRFPIDRRRVDARPDVIAAAAHKTKLTLVALSRRQLVDVDIISLRDYVSHT